MYRFDRDLEAGRRGGGGLVAFVRNHYNIEWIEKWNLCTYDIEYIWLKLNLKDTRPTYISGIYRPPRSNLNNAIELIENKLNDIYSDQLSDIIILGDWNVDIKQRREDPNTKIYKAFNKDNGLTQLITTPTRISKTSATLIDLNFTINMERMIQGYQIII